VCTISDLSVYLSFVFLGVVRRIFLYHLKGVLQTRCHRPILLSQRGYVCSAFCLSCSHLAYCIPRLNRRSHITELFPRFAFFRLMAAAYSALDISYCTFLCSHCSGLSFVRWYLPLFAFISFFCNVRPEFHHGTDLCRGSFLDVSLVCLNEDRHA
jgi:hypothetical protein